MADDQAPPEVRRLRKLLILCQAFSLTRDDRLDIARHVCVRDDIDSFKDLADSEVCRMLDAMTGAVLVAHVCLERKGRRSRPNRAPGPAEAYPDDQIRTLPQDIAVMGPAEGHGQ